MSFRLVPKSTNLHDRNGRYIASFILGSALYCIFSAVNTVIDLCFAMKSVVLWRNLCTSLLYFVVRVRCRRKKVHVRYLIS